MVAEQGWCQSCWAKGRHTVIYRRTVHRLVLKKYEPFWEYEDKLPPPPVDVIDFEYCLEPDGFAIHFCPNCGTML